VTYQPTFHFKKYNIEKAKVLLSKLPKQINAPSCDGFADLPEIELEEICQHVNNCDYLFDLAFEEDEHFYYCVYACAKDEKMYSNFGVDEDALAAVKKAVEWLLKEGWLPDEFLDKVVCFDKTEGALND
jgi:hypothetical protein